MSYDFDIIAIGSGAGGATLAYAAAKAGKSVLLVERGRVPSGESIRDEKATMIDKEPYDDRPVRVNGSAHRLYAGGVLGGGTALYGAALMRPSKEDFNPGKHYGRRIAREIWDWPINYDDLERYYTEAEDLYGVSGWDDEDYGPLEKPRCGYSGKPILPKPINRKLIDGNKARGLKPFRLPLAIDFSRCFQCGSCPGYICPNGSRRSSSHLVERGRDENLPLQVMTEVEVEYFSRNGRGQVVGVRLRDRSTGRITEYRAKRFILAAGAIASPILLLRSGITGPWIGRNYMMHLSPIVVGLFRRRTEADETYVKQIGFADYYLGSNLYPHKIGIVQSLPVPGPLMMRKMTGRRLPPALLQLVRKHMLPLTGIVEDLPNPMNRVTLGQDERPRLRHKFAPYDVERGRWLSGRMRRILRNAGAMICVAKSFPSHEHVAHQCGTLRFGHRPEHAALGSDCRLFGQPNVFVVDGSFFPTSLGVGPALTIMANALRVAEIVRQEL